MKKVILGVSSLCFAIALSIGSTDSTKADPLVEQCWYDHEGGCDSGGWAACGICDKDLPADE